jgi:hypothetical protein
VILNLVNPRFNITHEIKLIENRMSLQTLVKAPAVEISIESSQVIYKILNLNFFLGLWDRVAIASDLNAKL